MTIELGEVRQACEQNEELVLSNILDKYKEKTSYYIFKTSQWEGMFSTVIRTKYTLQSKKPAIAILGTKLWFVDNRKGICTKEWDLPLDIIGAEPFLETDGKSISQGNIESAKRYNMPILNA